MLLGATGEVSASPPQVAMDSTSPIATQTPRMCRIVVRCIGRLQTPSTMSDLALPHGRPSTDHDDACVDANPTAGWHEVQRRRGLRLTRVRGIPGAGQVTEKVGAALPIGL